MGKALVCRKWEALDLRAADAPTACPGPAEQLQWVDGRDSRDAIRHASAQKITPRVDWDNAARRAGEAIQEFNPLRKLFLLPLPVSPSALQKFFARNRRCAPFATACAG